MKAIAIHIVLSCCFVQFVYSQAGDGVVALDIPARNSLMFNRFVSNPTFSFVREQNKYISFTNKRELVGIEDAPLTYFANYSGRFKENIGAGIGIYQQNYGVLTTFGGILNFAYNVQIEEESNFTFGINIGAYKSGVDTGKVVTNLDDPALNNIPENFLLTLNPGINYGNGFMDFGVSLNNIATYNFSSSALLEDNPKQGVQGHMMYTGYFRGYGFFSDSRFSALAKSEFQKDATIVSGVMMLTVPKGVWAQVGYNTMYGATGGLGINLSPQIAVEYNYERTFVGLTNLGASHEITLAYRFKNTNYFDYSRDDEMAGLFTSTKKRKKKPKKTVAQTPPQPDAEEQARLAAEEQARLAAEEEARLAAEEEARLAAEEQARLDAEQLARLTAEEEARFAAEEQARLAADEQARLAAEEQARLAAGEEEAREAARKEAFRKSQEQARLAAEEQARLDAEERARLDAEEQARLASEEQARLAAEEQARLAAEEQARLAAEEQARLAAEEQAKLAAEEQARLAAEEQARLASEEQARLASEEQARLASEEQARLASEEQARLAAEEQARLASEEQARLAAEEQARLAAEEQARLAAEEQARLAAEEQARLAAEEQARLAAEEQAKRDAEAKAREAINPTDNLGKSISQLTAQSDNSNTIQSQLLNDLKEAVKVKEEDLNALIKENDMSEQNIAVEPRPFKSISAENRRIEELKINLDTILLRQKKKIVQLESLLQNRQNTISDPSDETNTYYRTKISELKAAREKAQRDRESLVSSLQQISVATDIERKRRIKRAAYDNVQDRYKQDRTMLTSLKRTVTKSQVPPTADSFDFGRERNNSIQILYNVPNEESGYYLVMAVHSDTAKRDEFLVQLLSTGEKEVDFFYDINTSEYYIYSRKFNSINPAENALKANQSKPYNQKVTLIKIEN